MEACENIREPYASFATGDVATLMHVLFDLSLLVTAYEYSRYYVLLSDPRVRHFGHTTKTRAMWWYTMCHLCFLVLILMVAILTGPFVLLACYAIRMDDLASPLQDWYLMQLLSLLAISNICFTVSLPRRRLSPTPSTLPRVELTRSKSCPNVPKFDKSML